MDGLACRWRNRLCGMSVSNFIAVDVIGVKQKQLENASSVVFCGSRDGNRDSDRWTPAAICVGPIISPCDHRCPPRPHWRHLYDGILTAERTAKSDGNLVFRPTIYLHYHRALVQQPTITHGHNLFIVIRIWYTTCSAEVQYNMTKLNKCWSDLSSTTFVYHVFSKHILHGELQWRRRMGDISWTRRISPYRPYRSMHPSKYHQSALFSF